MKDYQNVLKLSQFTLPQNVVKLTHIVFTGSI